MEGRVKPALLFFDKLLVAILTKEKTLGCRPRYDESREQENHLAETRVALGLTIKELAEIGGVSTTTVSALQDGMRSPTYERGPLKYRVKPWVEKICKGLGVSVGDMFPRDFCNIQRGLLNNVQMKELSVSEYSIQSSHNQCKKDYMPLYIAIFRLRKLDHEVIMMRFISGLTLEQIASRMHVTRERVRQIESRGLRMLRKHSLSLPIKELLYV